MINGYDTSAPTLAYDPVRKAILINNVAYDENIFSYLSNVACNIPRRPFRIVRSIDGVIGLEILEGAALKVFLTAAPIRRTDRRAFRAFRE